MFRSKTILMKKILLGTPMHKEGASESSSCSLDEGCWQGWGYIESIELSVHAGALIKLHHPSLGP